jgi:serine/threonine protein kinase/Flp pilus assembly protein TadD
MNTSERNRSVDPVAAELIEELINRIQAGEADVEAFIAAHPEHAEDLRRLLPAAQVLADLSRSAQADGSFPPTESGSAVGELGDFRIVREVGRGGMGVVYEAVQLSLDRRVALKVLPFAATMDPRHLQRFKNEARAAASLHHEHIVPVHGVGSERGVHYYAMQFIDGTTLAELIRGLRHTGDGPAGPPAARPDSDAPTAPMMALPTAWSRPLDRSHFRRAAELIAQAADALEYAHSVGVVHRDVKPGNLMVDAAGKLWVTDFGLAKLEAAASMTVSGDLVGTLRYMSPEQALAKHGLVDHRTDVYSLGATLYELLTLRPAVDGSDKEEILRRIAFEEPIALRKLDRSIPAELETITLKALAKEPGERYAAAKELADDLRRWLDGQAVWARRPTVRQRVARWVGHHPRMAAALVLVLFLGLAGGWAWDRQRAQAEAGASQVADQAEDLFRRRRLPEAEAVARRAADLLPRFGAAALKRRVTELVADLTLLRRLDDARLERLNTQPDARPPDPSASSALFAAAFREEYGVDVLGGDEGVVLAELGRRAPRQELIAALDDWASRAGNRDAAQRLVRLAGALDPDTQGVASQWRRMKWPLDGPELHRLAAEAVANPPPPTFLVPLALDLVDVSAHAEAVRLLRLAQQRRPDNLWINAALADALEKLGPDHAAEAVRFETAALALRPENPVTLGNLGRLLSELGRHEEALECCRQALAFRPNSPGIHLNLGVAFAGMKRYEEAAGEFQQAIALNPDYDKAWHNLGGALDELGRTEEAIKALQRARSLQPDALTCNRLSGALATLGRYPEAEQASLEAVKLDPKNAEANFRLGIALGRQNKYADAEAALRQAIQLEQDYAKAHAELGFVLLEQRNPDGAVTALRKAISLGFDDSDVHNNLGRALWKKGEMGAAITAYGEAIHLQPKNARAHYNLGLALNAAENPKRDPDRAKAEYREAIQLRPDFAEAHCNLGLALCREGNFAEGLPLLRKGHELGKRDPANWHYPSDRWVKEFEQLAALELLLPAVLAGRAEPADAVQAIALAEFSRVFKQQYRAAARLYTDAFAAEPKTAADPRSGKRYNAARAAAQAGCGQGADADRTDDAERTRLRQQALDWLRADLSGYRRLLDEEPDKAGPAVRERMEQWLQDKVFAGVRDPKKLANLPEAERQQWQTLRQEVEALRQRAAGPPVPQKEETPRKN